MRSKFKNCNSFAAEAVDATCSADTGRNRRSVIVGVAGIGAGALMPRSAAAQKEIAKAPVSIPQGYVLGAKGGVHLEHFRNTGHILIKADPKMGSDRFALGTQQVPVGAGIPVHRHPVMDEAFYVLEGSGTLTLNDVNHPFEKGGTLFIPRAVWHGFTNPEQELLLLWIVSPVGLDAFFRETCNPPGVPKKQFTREQVLAIARKYGTEFR